ncbi:MAG: glycerate 2-kinase, partial [Acidimicrobiaceae bacterium]|nr:glycerate 2-kinase [Acidimicrobiaceae bacterium]
MEAMPRVVAAPDKFRGTATARQVAGAVAAAAHAAGWTCQQVPIADGGEGLLD